MKFLKVVFICQILFFSAIKKDAQTTLNNENLRPLSYCFNIKDHQMSGEGAEFLQNEMLLSRFTILGVYSESQRIPEFTQTILPILNKLDYKTMAIDVGPISTQVLERLSSNGRGISEEINALNNRYGFKEGDRLHLPIPILRSAEESAYIEAAQDLGWNLIGLNNDSWNGLEMIVDELYSNLSQGEKQQYRTEHAVAVENLKGLNKDRNGDLIVFAKAFRENSRIQEFLNISSGTEENQKIIESIHYSLKKSEQYALKAYHEKNRDRIGFEKMILRKQLDALEFDISKEKLLVQVYRRHAAKGFQPDGFYGFSNTLQELASYHGDKSIHIGFFRRFYIEEEQVKDEMENDYYVRNRYGEVIQMGNKEEWTVIDLRPLMEGSYYSEKYILSPWIEKLMQQYDLIVIPPIELPTRANHKFKSN